jgi:glycosyltransferase involved in cell wall biosynthesis
MGTDDNDRRPPRKRLLITAYHYDREFSMESRLSWHRAQQAAREYDVTVICGRTDPSDRRPPMPADNGPERPVNVVHLPLKRVERALMSVRATFYAGYRRWLRRAFRAAERLHAVQPFDLVHHMSFCGYREPSDGWRLGAPFVWGPIGGTHEFPMGYWRELEPLAAIRELARNVINRRQMRRSGQVHRARNAAAAILAANRQVASDLRDTFGGLPVCLETGVSLRSESPRRRRHSGEPFRILWSGRLRPWKGLSLLLKALAALPADCDYRLRVLGEGPSQRPWQHLARKLGIDRRVEWAGWPEYSGQLPHYDWADAFAFTSLRDTSGTGLLEALAAGAPIIGVDHQGAADIMTDDCSIRVPISTPAATVAGFRDAILRLSTDSDCLERLTLGALRRAEDFQWEAHWEFMRHIYQQALDSSTNSAGGKSAVVPSHPRHQRPSAKSSPLEVVC